MATAHDTRFCTGRTEIGFEIRMLFVPAKFSSFPRRVAEAQKVSYLSRAPQHAFEAAIFGPGVFTPQGMIRKIANRFSLATNAKSVCAEIMLKQRDEIMMRCH